MVGWFGIKVNNTVMTLPIFLGLTISIRYSIHIFNVFKRHFLITGKRYASVIALVVIGLLMMIVLQSVKTGLIGMIPNIAPIFVVLGLMGYLNIPLDVVTMVVIPILLGLAVDDTIHFITHCKLEFPRTGNYRIAIQKIFQTVGNAIFMTSLIVVVAFSVYMLSVAVFFFHLSILFIAGVVAALPGGLLYHSYPGEIDKTIWGGISKRRSIIRSRDRIKNYLKLFE